MNEDIMRAAGMGDFVDAVNEGRCPWCKREVCEDDFKDKPEIFLKEFRISGICYECQEGFFESE